MSCMECMHFETNRFPFVRTCSLGKFVFDPVNDGCVRFVRSSSAKSCFCSVMSRHTNGLSALCVLTGCADWSSACSSCFVKRMEEKKRMERPVAVDY